MTFTCCRALLVSVFLQSFASSIKTCRERERACMMSIWLRFFVICISEDVAQLVVSLALSSRSILPFPFPFPSRSPISENIPITYISCRPFFCTWRRFIVFLPFDAPQFSVITNMGYNTRIKFYRTLYPPPSCMAGHRPTVGGDEVRAEADVGLVFVLLDVRYLQHHLVLDGTERREGYLRTAGLGRQCRKLRRGRSCDHIRLGADRWRDPLLCLQVSPRTRTFMHACMRSSSILMFFNVDNDRRHAPKNNAGGIRAIACCTDTE